MFSKFIKNNNGILLIDKPSGLTSHDVVFIVRKELKKLTNGKKIKVGHAGTLDPLATGLLIILIGNATKQSENIMQGDKEYEFNLLLGIKTETGDIDFENFKTQNPNYEHLFKNQVSKSKLKNVLNSLKGELKLKVPSYSAVKIKGKKLYELARKNKINENELPIRTSTIYSIKLLDFIPPIAKIRINCSKGTYIRSIGVEIGKRLNINSVVFNIRRVKSGKFNIKNAIKLQNYGTSKSS